MGRFDDPNWFKGMSDEQITNALLTPEDISYFNSATTEGFDPNRQSNWKEPSDKDQGGSNNSGGSRPQGRRPNPFLGQLKGMYAADMKKRKGESLGEKKNLLLRFGSQEMARKALGTELGAETDPFMNLISDDPDKSTSTMALLNKNYKDKQRESLSALNNLNLWFSSGQGETVNEIGRQKLQDVDTATAQLQGQLTGLDKDIASAETGWQQRLFDAEQQDWQAQAAYGTSGGVSEMGGGETEFQPGWVDYLGIGKEGYANRAEEYGAERGWSEPRIKYEGDPSGGGDRGGNGFWVKYNTPEGSSTEWVPL